MKNLVFLTILFAIISLTNAQEQNISRGSFDENEYQSILNKNSINNDTLWVCDSIIQHTGIGEKYAKDEVLARNDLGNVLISKFNMIFEPEGISGYSHLDTTTYFNDNEVIEKKSTSVYIRSTDSWETKYFKQYEYPDIDKEEFYKFYTSSTQEFSGGFKRYFSNRNSRCDTLFDFSLSDANTWENRYIVKYFYDNEDNDTLQIYKNWKNNDWVDSVKYQRIYNSEYLTDVYQYMWDEDSLDWTRNSHLCYSYNSAGLMDTSFQAFWTASEYEWQVMTRNIYTYDEYERYVTTLSQMYSYESQQLENSLLITDNYDNNNHTTVYMYWADNVWINDFKRFYSYTDFNRVDTAMSLDWDSSLSDWIPDTRSFTIFDFRNNANEYYSQYYENDDWKTLKKYNYYWSAFNPDFIDNESEKEVSVYPNPASSLITFSSNNTGPKTINIYTVSGRLIKSLKYNSNKYLMECNDLDKELYIYSISYENEIQSGKIIVQ